MFCWNLLVFYSFFRLLGSSDSASFLLADNSHCAYCRHLFERHYKVRRVLAESEGRSIKLSLFDCFSGAANCRHAPLDWHSDFQGRSVNTMFPYGVLGLLNCPH